MYSSACGLRPLRAIFDTMFRRICDYATFRSRNIANSLERAIPNILIIIDQALHLSMQQCNCVIVSRRISTGVRLALTQNINRIGRIARPLTRNTARPSRSSVISAQETMTPTSFFFFIIAIPRPIAEPPADPSRNWSGGRNNGLSSASPSRTRLDARAYEKNQEPCRAILCLTTNRGPSRFKAVGFFHVLRRLRAARAMAGRDFQSHLLFRRFGLGLVFLTKVSLLYAVHYRLVKANIRPGPSTRKSRSTASFPLPVFGRILLRSAKSRLRHSLA